MSGAYTNAALCEMPRANRPRASGETIRYNTDEPPADDPEIVTLRGSPPNAATLSWIHLSAAI